MRLKKIRTIKVWLYGYKNQNEKEVHMSLMKQSKFQVEKDNELQVEYSQVIKES